MSASVATTCRRWHGSGSRGCSADPQRLGEADPAVRYSASPATPRHAGTEAKLDLGSLDALLWSGLITSDAPSITDTLTHPTITNETSPHFAETLPLRQPARSDLSCFPRRERPHLFVQLPYKRLVFPGHKRGARLANLLDALDAP